MKKRPKKTDVIRDLIAWFVGLYVLFFFVLSQSPNSVVGAVVAALIASGLFVYTKYSHDTDE